MQEFIKIWQFLIEHNVITWTGIPITAVIVYFFRPIIDDWREARKLQKHGKRELAEEIIKICSEGDSHAYQKPPRDGEHIVYIANQIKLLDKKAEKSMRQYYLLWSLASDIIQREPKLIENIEFYRELEMKARAESEVLYACAKKWKK